MTTFVFNEAKRAIGEGEIDWPNASIGMVLVETGSAAGSSRNANFLSDISPLNRCTAPGYSANYPDDATVTGLSVQEVGGSNLCRYHAANTIFDNITAYVGSEVIIGAIYYLRGSPTDTDATRMPLVFTDWAGVTVDPDGSRITVRPPSTGVFYLG